MLRGSLLSETHPVGKSKAKFFRKLGFNENNLGKLEKALLSIAYENEVGNIKEIAYGISYVIKGTINSPRRKMVTIKTVWFIALGESNPRFVTAIPDIIHIKKESVKMNELDTVVLTHDIEDHGLKTGDMGAVVQIYDKGSAFEVEFVTADGKTIALLTLKPSDIRKVAKNEILHAREITANYSI